VQASRFRVSLLLLGIVFCLSIRAPAQTSLAETMATTEAQAELQAQTAEKVGPALEQQKQQGDQPVPKAPVKKKAPARPEVEKAELVQPRQGTVRIALHHVSEHRFFYSGGLVVLTLLVLLSTANQTARRIAGSFCVVGVLFLNALKMMVLPLILTSLVVGVTGVAEPSKLGSLGIQTLIYYKKNSL